MSAWIASRGLIKYDVPVATSGPAEGQGRRLRDIPPAENVLNAAANPKSVIAKKRSGVGDEIAPIGMGRGGSVLGFGKGEGTDEAEHCRKRR